MVGAVFLQVTTAEGSESAQSLLAPWNAGLPASFWRAPLGVSSVEFCVLLATPALVSSIVLLVSSCGYTRQNIPRVSNLCGEESSYFFSFFALCYFFLWFLLETRPV